MAFSSSVATATRPQETTCYHLTREGSQGAVAKMSQAGDRKKNNCGWLTGLNGGKESFFVTLFCYVLHNNNWGDCLDVCHICFTAQTLTRYDF